MHAGQIKIVTYINLLGLNCSFLLSNWQSELLFPKHLAQSLAKASKQQPIDRTVWQKPNKSVERFGSTNMNNSSDLNTTVPPPSSLFDPTFKYTIAAFYILIAVVAAVGNFSVCFAILANRKLRSNPTNLFLLSLAISDLLTATLAMPFAVEFLFLQGFWKHGKIMCITYITAYLITIPTSIFTLLAISVDRFMSLKDPLRRFRRSQFMTRARALIIISIIWIYSIIWGLLPIMGWRKKGLEPVYVGLCTLPFTLVYNITTSFINFTVPLLLTCVFFILAFVIACTHHRNVHRLSIQGSRHSSKDEAKVYVKNLRAAKTTSVFVAAFFFCWQPFTYFSIVSALYGAAHWKSYPWQVYAGLLMFGYLNSALNPFLFAFQNKRFKATYLKLFRSLKPASDPRSTTRRRSTISQSVSSEIPEMESKEVRLQSIQQMRPTPQPPKKHDSNAQL